MIIRGRVTPPPVKGVKVTRQTHIEKIQAAAKGLELAALSLRLVLGGKKLRKSKGVIILK